MGLEYNFDKALVTNSLKGHRLIQFAKTKGLAEKAEECLFYAYFTQGKNLSDVSTPASQGANKMQMSNWIGFIIVEITILVMPVLLLFKSTKEFFDCMCSSLFKSYYTFWKKE